VVSDVVYAARHFDHPIFTTFENKNQPSDEIVFEDDFETASFIHLDVKDMPGVLKDIATIFKDNNISIATMVQKEGRSQDSVPLVFITHKAKEKSIIKALDEITGLDSVNSLINMIRVES